MNELAVRQHIKQLILDNSDNLVIDLTFQNQPRVIHHVTYSGMTPPTGYFFISITTSNNTDNNRRNFGRANANTASESVYRVNVDVSDYIVFSPGEGEMFEKMDAEFQLFTDRIASLIRNTYTLGNSSGMNYHLDDNRTVTKDNVNTDWVEASQYHALLYSRISFDIYDSCTDDTTLY